VTEAINSETIANAAYEEAQPSPSQVLAEKIQELSDGINDVRNTVDEISGNEAAMGDVAYAIVNALESALDEHLPDGTVDTREVERLIDKLEEKLEEITQLADNFVEPASRHASADVENIVFNPQTHSVTMFLKR
jgi:hypothetical protein